MKVRLKHVTLLCLSILLITLASVASMLQPVLASIGTLDQSQSVVEKTYSLSSDYVAQTFTAGITGYLPEVDLVIGCALTTAPPLTCDGYSSVTVEIHSDSPTGALLASTSLPGSALPNFQAYTVPLYPASAFTFSSAPAIVAGSVYAIVIPKLPVQPYGVGAAGTTYYYSRGTIYFSTDGTTYVAEPDDIAFATYVLPTATGTSTETAPAVTVTPTTTLETVTQSPSTTLETVTQSLSTTLDTVTQSPSTTLDTVTQSPSTTLAAVTASPSTTLATVTQSPSTTLATVTASPSTTLATVTASPSKTLATVTQSPTATLSTVSATTLTGVVTTTETVTASRTTTVLTPITMTVSYGVVGGGSGYSAPVFHYVLNGVSKALTLTTTPTAVSADWGSPWSVTPTPLIGSTPSQRWFATQPLTGIAFPTTIQFFFQRQYYLTMLVTGPGSAGPSTGWPGSVAPGSGWQNAGQTLTIKATPTSGHKFISWTGVGTGSYSGTSNPATITMNSAITETASFT